MKHVFVSHSDDGGQSWTAPRQLATVVSRDDGIAWEDEAYYLTNGDAAGYASTISLDGDEMLTLTGSCCGDVESWDNCVGNTDFVIIRWRLA